MSLARRLPAVVLLLFLLAVSARGVPTSRSLKTIKEQLWYGNYKHVALGVNEKDEAGEGLKIEGRMSIQVNDYPGTGANHDHDPTPPGKRG